MLVLELIKDYKVVLVSQSPRRKELLKAMGIHFSVAKAPVEEVYPSGMPAKKVAKYLSKLKFEKACSTINHTAKTLFITADTIVVSGNMLLGKPADIGEAKKMLMSLGGKYHTVITGVCFGNRYGKKCFDAKTKVFFEAMEEAEAEYYATHYNVLDKAGGYGIQDWIGITKISGIKGSYTNVMGLPTQKLYKNLKKFLTKKE